MNIEKSALWTFFAIVVLFASAVIVTLLAPNYIDPTWTSPTSSYQVQVYEVSDPNVYLSGAYAGANDLQSVYHLKKDFTLLAFRETDTMKILAHPQLANFITHDEDPSLKLTTRVLLLRKPVGDFIVIAEEERKKLQEAWVKAHPNWEERKLTMPSFEVLELFNPERDEAFAVAPVEGILENWVDNDYVILEGTKEPYHENIGVVYVNNPREYRIAFTEFGPEKRWRFDPEGKPITSLDELKAPPLGFRSREDLIAYGEHLYAIEGCWYCHTDQTRTLVQDVVLNGSDSFPAPPSSANEYIYQEITFPGTRRIGPDMSRVGVKRPSRDWHQSHFWAPKLASKGSIMPAFQHFFDYDPRGTSKSDVGIPNYKFESIFQYLMTKGTRITPPTEAWWLGKDPIQTKEIIEGRKKV